ncbi:exodeoxyribonuclease V subunit beta [Alteromonas oceanisediminis]|uniref:exodeoxyribonuclease V subunit beta n=1 Tax=Alteromonas oceanisediminis TaxID=2836180 RepID=UPI001BDA6304|nr:exodeoxyribonuclease V subunit beta [Alteromonas oceanisediminis]MBT0587346.1 exodeoxyribonuclease V subunit beta [Alteromonas oceanisediminis]
MARLHQPLNVATTPLSGQHLIEASAGTGKTYNITRLYLRLILEADLSVTQILVMTFTNAATQELRGRLTETLRSALTFWQRATSTTIQDAEPVLVALYQKVPTEIAIQRLSLALVEMDEAAIFTLHGFCHRVLKQMAFGAGKPLQFALQNDQTHVVQRCTEDWFRVIRNDVAKMTLLRQQHWHTPTAFLHTFQHLIYGTEPVVIPTPEVLYQDYQQQLTNYVASRADEFRHHLDTLKAHQTAVHHAIVHGHQDEESRLEEWSILLDWLRRGADAQSDVIAVPTEVGLFLNGNRYRTKPDAKAVLKPIAELRTSLKKDADKLAGVYQATLDAAAVYECVAEGVSNIQQQVRSAKQMNAELSFDDLIALLTHAVQHDAHVATALRTQFPAALIDEFQDTDAQQYTILRHVYTGFEVAELPTPDTPLLMMIGDPKQAIYGFRGGDIFTYLKARDDAQYVWLMDTNWRSVANMVSAYNRLFWGDAVSGNAADVFGFGIEYELIQSTPHSAAAKRPLQDPLSQQREAMSCILSPQLENEEGTIGQQKQQHHVALSKWCVLEIKRLLAEVSLGERPVRPSDIAILVRGRHEAERIGAHLRTVGLNAVYLSDRTPLFESQQAHELLRVLNGIWLCQNDSELIRALSSDLLGISAERLAAMHRDPLHGNWSELRSMCIELRQLWLDKGTMALLFELIREHFTPHVNGERALTNLMHLTEILEQMAREQAHPLQVIHWLRGQINAPDIDEQYEQRLESDAGLVKIITQHKSKGLEYPFVFLPYASDYRDPTKQGPATKHIFTLYDPELGQRVTQCGATHRSLRLLAEQEHAENMRLLYVAVTRAEYRCYVGIADTDTSRLSAFGAAVYATQDAQKSWQDVLSSLCAEPGSGWTCTAVSALPEPASSNTVSLEQEALIPRLFNGDLRSGWHIHSFSGLIRSSASVSLLQREAENIDTADASAMSSLQDISPVWTADARFVFAKGASAGNFLHDVLENTDFMAPDWQALLLHTNAHYGVMAHDQSDATIAWLDSVLHTDIVLPTGDMVNLAQLTPAQTLREAEFYFPLKQVSVEKVMTLLAQHRQRQIEKGLIASEAAPPAPQLSMAQLEGLLHGFIDLIFEHNGRYYVADYKSNFLGDHFNAYLPAELAASSMSHGYDLQYLLYSVALHRYLQAMLPDYRVGTHFGGVVYLYLRGMHPHNQHQQGVLSVEIDEPLLTELDKAFSNDAV